MEENKYADIVYFGGKIVTVNKNDDIAEAIAIKDNKILKVGSKQCIEELINENTKVIDLEGRCIVPGFIDAHMHFMMYSLFYKATIDIAYDKVQSIEQIKELIKEAAKKKKPGEWICLWGYDQNKLIEKRHPSIEDLDEAAPNNPVQCVRCCGHMGVYNTKAFEIGNITPEKYAEGEVVTDSSGKVTGLLKETPNDELWGYIKHSDDELKEGYRAFGQLMLKSGITSIHDAGTYGGQYVKVLQDVSYDKTFPVRMYIILYNVLGKAASKKWIYDYISTGAHTGLGNEHFKIGAAKILLDGSTSGPSCATREPYSHDKDLKGILNWKQDEVNKLFLDAQNAGFQVTAHAVGDKAVEQAINAIEYTLEHCKEGSKLRNRIEHCGLIDEELLNKIKKLNIIPISNPGFFTINGKDYNRYYGDRVNYMFSVKSYKENGIITAFGSDCSVINENPMLGIYGAVTRKDIQNNEECGPCQKVSVLDAIRCYTYNGAYASFEEDIKGSLEEGKLADLVVLSDDILEIDQEAIKDVKVDMTMIDGQILYERV